MRLLITNLVWLVFGVWTVICASTVVVAAIVPGSRPVLDAVQRYWAGLGYLLAGSKVPDAINDQLPDAGPYVIMANHEGFMDVLLFLWKYRPGVRFVAKKELSYVPIFGFGMWRMGHIFVDRGNREAAIRSLQHAGEKIRNGTNVLVYPEGTRNPTPGGALLPFKKGGFMLALEAGVPILPVGVAGAGEMIPKGEYRFYPGVIAHRIGTPIPTAGLTLADRDRLMDEVRTAIDELRAQARAEREAYLVARRQSHA